jgi:hypothetical protein
MTKQIGLTESNQIQLYVGAFSQLTRSVHGCRDNYTCVEFHVQQGIYQRQQIPYLRLIGKP